MVSRDEGLSQKGENLRTQSCGPGAQQVKSLVEILTTLRDDLAVLKIYKLGQTRAVGAQISQVFSIFSGKTLASNKYYFSLHGWVLCLLPKVYLKVWLTFWLFPSLPFYEVPWIGTMSFLFTCPSVAELLAEFLKCLLVTISPLISVSFHLTRNLGCLWYNLGWQEWRSFTFIPNFTICQEASYRVQESLGVCEMFLRTARIPHFVNQKYLDSPQLSLESLRENRNCYLMHVSYA